MSALVKGVTNAFGALFGGLKPVKAEAAPRATESVQAEDTSQASDRPGGFQSFISTAQSGLTRKATTRKRSLIGGA